MTILSTDEILLKIKRRDTFTATVAGSAFTLKIEKYEPALCAAIHNGGNMRPELVENCLLSKDERYYEEDPFTGSFIEQQSITLIGHDSRYEYDLNRTLNECVYETAWGKEVWKDPLSTNSIAVSKEKHAEFYRVVSAVVEALAEDFGQCLVYDTHSYNYRRHERTDLPVFNLGTTSVKSDRWRPVIETWLEALAGMSIDKVDVTAAENDIFFGKGCLAGYCHGLYDNILVLPTEVKKVFMNELTGEEDKLVLPALQKTFNKTITENTKNFINSMRT